MTQEKTTPIHTYIVYQTTCLVNGKIYVGVHMLRKNSQQYLGSGIALKSAIRQYGRDQFVRETLYEFDNQKDAYQKEMRIVTEDFLAREDTYNIKLGGMGGTSGWRHSSISLHKMSKSHKGALFSPEHRAKLSLAHKGKKCH